MDNIDKRLLEILADDARKPIKRIASEAGVSREVADYRIKKLEKEVIGGYKARLNLSRLTHSSYFIFLRSKKVKDTFLHFLRNVKYPHWIGRASGKWDVLLSFSIQEQEELDKTIASILGEDTKEHLVLTQTKEYFDSTMFSKEKLSSYAGGGKIILDKVDEEILRMLSENCRVSNKEIGKKVKLTSEAVNYRIKKLEEDKIILGYRTIVNLPDYETYSVLLKFSGKADIEDYLKNSRFTFATNTSNGILLTITTKDIKEFHDVMKDLRNEFSETLDSFEILRLIDYQKHE